MKKNLRTLLMEIQQLEEAVVARLRKQEKKFMFSLLGRKVLFPEKTRQGHRAVQKNVIRYLFENSFAGLATSLVIYGFIIPTVILDVSVAIYQSIVFTVYKIPMVRRSDYIAMDRGQLLYLNVIERFNCQYCSYVNGLISYTHEIASRTEQYFCPIRHAVKSLGLHPRHNYFLPYGDAVKYHAKLKKLRQQLQKKSTKKPDSDQIDQSQGFLNFVVCRISSFRHSNHRRLHQCASLFNPPFNKIQVFLTRDCYTPSALKTIA